LSKTYRQAGSTNTVQRRTPFSFWIGGTSSLIMSAPQDEQSSCGGMAIAYAAIVWRYSPGMPSLSTTTTSPLLDTANLKTMCQAMNAQSFIYDQTYWDGLPKEALYSDELKALGADLYHTANRWVNRPKPDAQLPVGLSASDMYRFVYTMMCFGALSIWPAFELRLYGWPNVGGVGQKYHWTLAMNGSVFSSAPESDGNPYQGAGPVGALPTGSNPYATVVAGGDGSLTYTKKIGSYEGPGAEGVALAGRPGTVTKDSSGADTADAAAKAVLGIT